MRKEILIMNKRFVVLIFIPTIIVATARGQAFSNLDFEAASVVPVSTNNGEIFINAAQALPGWTAFAGTNQLSTIPYNFYAFANGISLAVSNAALDGNFGVFMAANGQIRPIGISQTGLVPANAESLTFEAYALPTVAPPYVTLGGQQLSLTTTSQGVNSYGQDYTVYGTDISAFADNTETLSFFVDGYLDDIQFSPEAIPEPSALSLLLVAGGVLVSLRARRRRAPPFQSKPPGGD
jgi:PEP-CTERM motif